MSKKIIQQLLKSRVTGKAKSKSLSAATPVVEDPTLQTWIKEVSSTIKDVAGSSVRKSDLVRAGIVTINNGELQNALTPNEEVNLTIPAAVVNLAANGAYSSITLDWETKPSKYFGQNTIYRSDVDDFGTATQIGSTLGDVYTDYVGNHIKAYYWVRTISKFGVEGDLAPSVYAETAIDVAYVMDQISGQIDKSHLNQLLQSEIGKIEQNTSDLIQEIKNRATAVTNLANQLRLEAEQRVLDAKDRINEVLSYIDSEILEKTVEEAKARAAAIADEASKRTTELLAKANELKTEFTALNAQRIQDILLLNDGLTSEVTSRKAGDAANLTALNNYKISNNAALSNISETLNTAVDSGQATAEKVTALDTRLTTNEQVSSTALTKAESAVTSNSALASKVDNLAAIITDIGEGAETNVDVYAFNALKVEVNAQGEQVDTISSDLTSLKGTVSNLGNITNATNNAVSELKTQQTATGTKVNQQGESITLLQNSVAILNDDLDTKVDSETFDSLTSQVEQDRANITAQGQRITNIQNTLETTNNKINTKADASALTATDSKVANIDGRTTTNTNDTTNLKGRMSTVENGLSTKAEVSALNNIYTKTQTDAKATEIAAGKVEEFKATLGGSGMNLFGYAMSTLMGSSGTWNGSSYSVTRMPGQGVAGDDAYRIKAGSTSTGANFYSGQGDWRTPSEPGVDYIVSLYIKSPKAKPVRLRQIGTNAALVTSLSTATKDFNLEANVWTRISIKYTARADHEYIGWCVYHNMDGAPVSDDNYVLISRPMAERAYGTSDKPSNWVEGGGVSNQVAANSTAIQNIDASVVHANGRIDAANSANTALAGRLAKVEGQVSTKAEASALNAINTRLITEEGKSTSQGNAITSLQNSINHATTGLATKASTIALNSTNSEVSRVDGVVKGHAGQLTQLASSINTINGNLANKADASALNDIYTKTQTDTKATEIAAGELSKYDSSLVIGGTNLQTNSDFKSNSVNRWSGIYGAVTSINGGIRYKGTSVNGAARLHKTLTGLEARKKYTLSVWVKSPVPLEFRSPVDATEHNKEVPVTHDPSVFQRYTYTFTPSIATGAILRAYVPNVALTDEVVINKEKLEEGTKGTDWSPSPEDIQSSLDANATAITDTKTEVARVDGRVATTSSNLTALTGRVSTVEGQVSTKADVSAVNALTTRLGDVEGGLQIQANNTTSLEAKLDSRNSASLIPDYYLANHNEWVSHYDYNLAHQFVTTAQGSIGPNIFFKRNSPTPDPNNNWNYSKTRLPNNRKYKLSMLVRGVAGAEGLHYFTGRTFDSKGEQITYLSTQVTAQAPADGRWRLVTAVVDWTANNAATIAFGFAVGHTGDSSKGWWMVQGFSVKDVITVDDTDDTVASAAALTTTNAEVSRVDGAVKSQATQITNLTGTIAGKADTAALNALNVRLTNEENKSTSQATSLTNLEASLTYTDKIAKNALPKIGGSSSFKTFKEVLNYYLSISGSANNIVIETPITFSANMFSISGKGYNYATTKSVIDFEVSGYAYRDTTVLQHGARNAGTYPMRIRLGAKNGKLCVILSPQGTNWAYPAFKVDAAISYGTVSDTFQEGWSGLLVTEASLASSGITAIIEPSMMDVGTELTANATAVTSLTTEVSRVNGVATSAANSTTLLTSRMGAAENKLLVQGKVTDGVRSSYVVKMETGNVVGGFGMVQETGALGNVITSFGVNADTFFIGSPSGKKKPFAVLGTSGLINGVTVPAGTYIDTAYIPNGTITNAKIGNLSADKITTGSIAADRMKANIVSAMSGQFTSLSSISATIGVLRTKTSGARTEIKDNLIEVYDASGQVRVRLGVW